MMNWGFRGKVILASIIPVLLMAAIVSFAIINHQLNQQQRAFQLHAQSISRLLAGELGKPEVFNNPELLERVLNRYLLEAYISGIIVNDIKDDEISNMGTVAEPNNTNYYYTSSIIQNTADEDTSFKPSRSQLILGTVKTYFSNRHLSVARNNLIKHATTIILVAIVASILIALAFYRSIVQSVSNLKRAIHLISQGRFDTRIASTSYDEIGMLEKDINEMTAVLQDIQDDMQQRIEAGEKQLQDSLAEIESNNEEYLQAGRKAMEAVRIKSDFMANMSHEIRTPMNGIIGFANLLLKSKLTHEQNEYTQTIKTSATNLLAIINDILDFSKLETGELVIENSDINLREVIEDVVNYMSTSAHDKGLEILLMFYDDVPEYIISDAVRIRQVASHLIANAIKFTRQGQIFVRVMLEDDNDEDCKIKISVQDSGVGLSLKNQRKLFTAFNQADTTTTREFGGAGLGLVICRGIAEKMNGSIGLESKLAIGSTFWFLFPSQKQTGRLVIQTQDALTGTRCLLYDCNHSSRNIPAHHLRSWNIELTETDSAEKVSQLVNNARNEGEPFQFVILSLSNREVHENSVSKILENIIDEHHYAFVTLINSTSQENYDACYRMGADVCLPKNVRKKDFYHSLCSLLPDHFNLAVSVNTEKRELSTTPYDLSALKIMVVDDNRINRKLVSTLLQQSFAQVHEATTGKEAVDMALTSSFDLIFMDIHMPIMNGIDATRKIRSSEHGEQRTPIVALTANAVRGERERLLRSGLDACLIKPLQEQDLWGAILKWVEPTKIKPIQYKKMLPGQQLPESSQQISYTQHAIGRIDTDQALQFAGGNKELANELYNMFIEDLPNMKNKLINAFEKNDLLLIEEEAHKIHGAASCCAIFQIKDAANNLEKATIRSKTEEIPQYYQILLGTIDQMLNDQRTINE
jgi:two-component system sensor histidine kinase BarA